MDSQKEGRLFGEAKQAIRSRLPQFLLNWREGRYYAKYGEVEIHLLEFLCRRDHDAIDVGANYGSYVHFMRRYARHVYAYEPMPRLAQMLRQKFRHDVTVEAIALSDSTGSAALRMPVIDGVPVDGCSTISDGASANYPTLNVTEVPMDRLDNVYGGDVGFIKIDVEGHEQAVLDGAIDTIRRCLPRVQVEIDERLAPGELARANAFFAELGYRGFFVCNGRVEGIERFSIADMQDPANLPDLKAPLKARLRFERYIYNFIFLPPNEPDETLCRMREQLAGMVRRNHTDPTIRPLE
jgi:FkbM family methyltransferase